MREGERNRAVGQTSMNERSSRSHSVVSIQVAGKDRRSGAKLSGFLNLVDLAGRCDFAATGFPLPLPLPRRLWVFVTSKRV
jgi:hypothetical protein